MKVTLVLSLAAALLTSSAGAMAATSTGTIRGDGKPNEQIVVINDASGTIVGVMTDGSGHFEAKDLPAGQYKVARGSAKSRTTGAPVFAGRVTDVVLPKD